MSYPKGVSLVICTYNGTSRLLETIEHINEQQVDPVIDWELLVIDNASDDGTGDFIRELWKTNKPLRVVVEHNRGVAHARYRGISEARYEYVSFIDDDNWIDPMWIQNVFNIFENNPDVGICGSMNEGVFEIEPPVWFEKVERAYAIGKQAEKTGNNVPKGHIWGAGMCFRKIAWDKILDSGFRPVLSGRKGSKNLIPGEDTEISFAFRMAGWDPWFFEELKLKHYIPANRLNWNYVVKMYKGFGSSNAIFEIYHLVMKNKPYRPFRLYRRLFEKYRTYYSMKAKGIFKENEGNRDFLKYYFYHSRFWQAIKNFRMNKRIYKELKDYKEAINSG